MGWLQQLFGKTVAVDDGVPVDTGGRLTLARIDFHIRRYTLAIEQCKKGGDRLHELRRGLEYWQTVRAAQTMKQEA